MDGSGCAAGRRGLAAALATLALALAVAALIDRKPPDFSALPVAAVVRDAANHPLWAIRIATASHQIAVDCLNPACPPPPDRQYKLWLARGGGGNAATALGLLPRAGRKVIPEMPVLFPRLAVAGELLVSLEKTHGPDTVRPSGPILFHTDLRPPG